MNLIRKKSPSLYPYVLYANPTADKQPLKVQGSSASAKGNGQTVNALTTVAWGKLSLKGASAACAHAFYEAAQAAVGAGAGVEASDFLTLTLSLSLPTWLWPTVTKSRPGTKKKSRREEPYKNRASADDSLLSDCVRL